MHVLSHAAFAAVLFGAAQGLRLSKNRKSTCGLKGRVQTQRNGTSISIVNGEDAEECEWKWQVGLTREVGKMPFCGGQLIAADWVLTAAHCGDAPGFMVVAGDYKPKQRSGQEQARRAVQVIQHPLYWGESKKWDLMLVRLETPMELGSCVGTVCLPTEGEDVQPGSKCWITGWGTLASDGPRPDVLQEAEVTVMSNEMCRKSGYEDKDIHKSMFCAQGVDQSGRPTDGCQGDSGGPLVCEAEGVWTLYGATSWGYGCGDARWPGVWARVPAALEWIEGILENPGPVPYPDICPSSSSTRYPDFWGDCECPFGTTCSLNGGSGNCPSSDGNSGDYFLPNCWDCKCA